MLHLIKKIFQKKENLQEERINLNDLDAWLEQKSRPIFENLKSNISQIIQKISDERQKTAENLKALENAELQNPNIPYRAKTIMEGNRQAFINKISYLLTSIDLDYKDYDELLHKSTKFIDRIDDLGKSTARSFHVLNEFFAREAEKIAANIKNLENSSREIISAVKASKIEGIQGINNGIRELKDKIKLKNTLLADLEGNKDMLKNGESKKLESENSINEIKSSREYKKYQNLIEEKSNIEAEMRNIENDIFHQFSTLEKALKKYAKIAFENEKLILTYLENPINSLVEDSDFKIVEILSKLKDAIERNALGLEDKKSEKTIATIENLDSVYFTKARDNYLKSNVILKDIAGKIEANESRKKLEVLNHKLRSMEDESGQINNKIQSINNELKKIDIEKLKEGIQKEIFETVNTGVVIL